MITYEELKALNARLVEDALRDLGLRDPNNERIARIAKVCETHIGRNEALKQKVKARPDRQQVWQAIDARNLPLKEILTIAKEDQ